MSLAIKQTQYKKNNKIKLDFIKLSLRKYTIHRFLAHFSLTHLTLLIVVCWSVEENIYSIK